MTKNVRIENADTSTKSIEIEIWEKTTAPDATGASVTTHKMTDQKFLPYPTSMETITIWSGKYLIIREKED